MKLALYLFASALCASVTHADSKYHCTNVRGDSVNLEFTKEGKRVSLRSLHQQMTFAQSKVKPKNDRYTYGGRYPNGAGGYSVGIIYVQASLVNGVVDTENVVGTMSMEGDKFGCKSGEGKLAVSKETRREFASPRPRREPCKLTSYWQGMTFMPPRIVCNYGGVTMIRGAGGLF